MKSKLRVRVKLIVEREYDYSENIMEPILGMETAYDFGETGSNSLNVPNDEQINKDWMQLAQDLAKNFYAVNKDKIPKFTDLPIRELEKNELAQEFYAELVQHDMTRCRNNNCSINSILLDELTNNGGLSNGFTTQEQTDQENKESQEHLMNSYNQKELGDGFRHQSTYFTNELPHQFQQQRPTLKQTQGGNVIYKYLPGTKFQQQIVKGFRPEIQQKEQKDSLPNIFSSHVTEPKRNHPGQKNLDNKYHVEFEE